MTLHELDEARETGWSLLYPEEQIRITVGTGTCGIAAGASVVLECLRQLTEEAGLDCAVCETGCLGACFAEPLVGVHVPGLPRVTYEHVDETFCKSLVAALSEGVLPDAKMLGFSRRDWAEGYGDWIDLCAEEDIPFDATLDLERHPFFASQTKRLTASWGVTNPPSAAEYAALGGYSGLKRCLSELEPDELIAAVEKSGLRGRGGAGFPTGTKMRAVAEAAPGPRYLIVNADEGDPGAYMDRGLLESDPHRLIEGAAIAAWATGACQGYVFTRAEYPGAVATLEAAIREARQAGALGPDAFGPGRGFDLRVVRSAGAYICGEESALIAALEGRRPDPTRKPPYPSERGLEGRPTLVSNVETFANLPSIALHGPDAFRRVGTQASPGTKIFSLAGSIERAGLVEVPLGMPVADMIDAIAAPKNADERNVVCPGTLRDIAVQIGGPSGAILPASLPNLTLDFEGLADAGGIMGSGGIVVLGGRSCIVDTVRYFTDFSARSSCGQCRMCAKGLADAAHILTRICMGLGHPEDLSELERLCERIPKGSKCALGSMAVKPLASALRFYRDEFESHLAGECPGLVCKELMHFEVIEKDCPGCLCCLPSCPTGAIKGVFGKAFRIEQERCTKCWMCVAQCPYPALMALPRAAQGSAEPVPPEPPRFTRPESCVGCGRCVAACAEAGHRVLGMMGSGMSRHVELLVPEGAQAPCEGCGACRDACPTHAIDIILAQAEPPQ